MLIRNRKTKYYKGGWLCILLFLSSCGSEITIEPVSVLGEMIHPNDNPSSEAKVELGRLLFFDTRLSSDNSISCASCHVPEYAFTDRKPLSIGVDGGVSMRNAPTLLNVGYQETVMFDAEIKSLEMQVPVPIKEHVEMNMRIDSLILRLKKVPQYRELAKKAFNREIDAWVLTRSISAFERTLISDASQFDQFYYHNDPKALNASEKAGWKLFSEELYCTTCHAPPHFTNFQAENNGLYMDYGEDLGRFRIDFDSLEIGSFKVPTLRNIELTYPYMHDGSLSSLEEVVEHYANGAQGHPNQHPIIESVNLSESEKQHLIDFLKSLTDTSYMTYFR